jgi:hypothetical protein
MRVAIVTDTGAITDLATTHAAPTPPRLVVAAKGQDEGVAV